MSYFTIIGIMLGLLMRLKIFSAILLCPISIPVKGEMSIFQNIKHVILRSYSGLKLNNVMKLSNYLKKVDIEVILDFREKY